MSKVNPDQAIFDAISAAVSRARNFNATSIEIVIDTKAFIETFNNHRDRKLCTSLNPLPDNGRLNIQMPPVKPTMGSSRPTDPAPEPVAMLGGIHGVKLIRHIEAMRPEARTEYHTPLYKHPPQPTPLLPCPVCGGEAIHAIDTLKRVIIKPDEPEQDK